MNVVRAAGRYIPTGCSASLIGTEYVWRSEKLLRYPGLCDLGQRQRETERFAADVIAATVATHSGSPDVPARFGMKAKPDRRSLNS